MFETNEYFAGKVKSIAFADSKGDATIGVMAAGEYEFGTSTVEVMTVISGEMKIQLADCDCWQEYSKYDSFTIEANTKFKVKVNDNATYICRYYQNPCGCNC